MEHVDVGLDISTRAVGVCALGEDGSPRLIEVIKLNKSGVDDHWDKAELLKGELARLFPRQRYQVRNLFVEEAHKRFAPGMSSAQTLFLLAKFNGIACLVAKNVFDVKPKMISVTTARKTLGIKIDRKDKSKTNKQKVFEAVHGRNPGFLWDTRVVNGEPQLTSYAQDQADAWVMCRAGQILSEASTKQ